MQDYERETWEAVARRAAEQRQEYEARTNRQTAEQEAWHSGNEAYRVGNLHRQEDETADLRLIGEAHRLLAEVEERVSARRQIIGPYNRDQFHAEWPAIYQQRQAEAKEKAQRDAQVARRQQAVKYGL
jgi:hypothetical protein